MSVYGCIRKGNGKQCRGFEGFMLCKGSLRGLRDMQDSEC
jgi:hypothetical protein